MYDFFAAAFTNNTAIFQWFVVSALIFLTLNPLRSYLSPRARQDLGTFFKRGNLRQFPSVVLQSFLLLYDHTLSVRKDPNREVYFPSVLRSATSTALSAAVVLTLLFDSGGSVDAAKHILLNMDVKGVTLPLPLSDTRIVREDLTLRVGSFPLWSFFITSMVVNLVIDFFSNAKSRTLLSIISRSPLWKWPHLFLADLALTCLIVIAGLLITHIIHDIILSIQLNRWVLSETGSLLSLSASALPLALCEVSGRYQYCHSFPISWMAGSVSTFYLMLSVPLILTTFFTSIWVTLYLLLFLLFRSIASLQPVFFVIDYLIDAQKEPIRAVAVGMFGVWTLFCAARFLF